MSVDLTRDHRPPPEPQRGWWPRTCDLAAMVGLSDRAGPGRRAPDAGPTGQDDESLTVLAARLSQLFK